MRKDKELKEMISYSVITTDFLPFQGNFPH